MADLSNISILVIDDEMIQRSIIRHVLEQAGAMVTEAEDGAQALRVLAEEKVDIAITDIVMLGMDGVSFIAHARKDYPELKILAMTGEKPDEEKWDFLRFARRVGADEALVKPIDSRAMLDTLTRVTADMVAADPLAVLRMERNRFQSLAFCIGDACLEFDESRTVLYAAGAFDRLVKTDSRKLVGLSITAIIHPNDLARFTDTIGKAKRNGKSEGINMRLKVGDEASIPLQYGLRWRESDGGRYVVMFLGHRIGEHANLEG